jgi:bacteriocin biosynthesis cyclodehydratase domain-containing protein
MEEGPAFPEVLLRGLVSLIAVRLPEQPRLAPWLTRVDLGDDRVQLRAVDFALTISDPLLANAFRHVEPMLDGRHALEEIVSAGEPLYLRGTVEIVLKMLRQRGALQEGKAAPELGADTRRRFEMALRLFAHHTNDADAVLVKLQQAKVIVHGDPELCPEIGRALDSMGVGHVAVSSSGQAPPEAAPSELLVVATRSPSTAFFHQVNRACLESGARWLRVAYEGPYGILGPTIVPGQTACFDCYTRRRATHDVLEGLDAYRDKVAARGEPLEGEVSPLRSVLVGQTALEVARLISGFAPPATFGRFYTFEVATPKVAGHDVLRVPRCPSCGLRQASRDPWENRIPASEDRE